MVWVTVWYVVPFVSILVPLCQLYSGTRFTRWRDYDSKDLLIRLKRNICNEKREVNGAPCLSALLCNHGTLCQHSTMTVQREGDKMSAKGISSSDRRVIGRTINPITAGKLSWAFLERGSCVYL